MSQMWNVRVTYMIDADHAFPYGSTIEREVTFTMKTMRSTSMEAITAAFDDVRAVFGMPDMNVAGHISDVSATLWRPGNS